MTGTSVEVDAGRIVLRPSLSDMLLCGQIPGGTWDLRRKAWSFPATTKIAAAIQARIRNLNATEQFDAILQPESVIVKSVENHLQNTPSDQAVANVERLPVAPSEPEIAIPEGMLTRPWRHQAAAFSFCMEHFGRGMHGVLLSMWMGTGKSLVVCMLVLATSAKCVLIACPLRVVPVWLAQFERHVGTPLIVVRLDEEAGSVAQKRELAEEKLKLAQARGIPFIAVINYDGVWRDPFAAWVEKVQWDVAVADECHRLKASSGKASIFFKRLRTRTTHRIGLSGTPMPHGPMDIYAQFRFLDISIFGPSFSAFRQTYAVMGGYQNKQIAGFQNLDQLERLMSKITFRAGKEVLDLPPATEVTYHCELTGEARRIYKDLEEDFVARVLDGTVTAANAMVKLLRLQQVTGGVVPTDDGVVHRVDNSKQKLLVDTLEDIGTEEPVVVFCRFRADLSAIHEACEEMKIASLELSGTRNEIERWQAGEAQLLAVQIDAGGEGVDMTRARYSIFFSVGFSLGKYEQAKARTHRPGQNKAVTHIHLVARNTVDVKIMRALEKRAEVVQSILAEITN